MQLLLLKFETVWLLIKLSSTCAHHNQLRKTTPNHSLPQSPKTNQQKNPQAQKLLFTPSPSKSPSFQTSVKRPVSHQEVSCEKAASSHPSTPTLTPPLLLFLSSRACKCVLLGNLLLFFFFFFFFFSLRLVPLRTLLNFPTKRSKIQNREQEKKKSICYFTYSWCKSATHWQQPTNNYSPREGNKGWGGGAQQQRQGRKKN